MRIFIWVALMVSSWSGPAAAMCTIIHPELENAELPRQYPLAKEIVWEIGSPSSEGFFVAYGEISRTSDRPLLHEGIEIKLAQDYPLPEREYYEGNTIPYYELNVTYYTEFEFSGKVLIEGVWETFEHAPVSVSLAVNESGPEFVPTWPFYSILRQVRDGWGYTASSCGTHAPETKTPEEFEELAACIPSGTCLDPVRE